MIGQITNILTNPTFVRFAQNTRATVTTESLFKATGRPFFIMHDKSIDDKTKKYTATKEAVYQMLCLGIYLGIVGPVFKKPIFKAAQKILKNEKDLPKFKNVGEYESYRKLALMPLKNRQNHALLEKVPTNLHKDLLTLEHPNLYKTEKGVIELSYLVGTILGLALFASELSNLIIHPTMKTLGFEPKKAAKNKVPTQNVTPNKNKINAKA